jgi:glycosyltransferase involved in cell wall biosynthesis
MVPEMSVVISTYNRKDSLMRALDSILNQASAPEYELIVVDNNSTDGTRETVSAYKSRDTRIHYVFESRQGVSYGRNAGIAAAQAALIAFTDDDVVVAPDWLAAMKTVFDEHADFGCAGGTVAAIWPKAPPRWLTKEHWGPLALVDYGAAQAMNSANKKCLITANMGVRKKVFDEIGGFRTDVQRTPWVACAIEDKELQERYWAAGGKCWFDPRIHVQAEVPPGRLRKRYHRRWHFSHGEAHAVLRDQDFEESRIRFLGIPGHVVRRAVSESLQTLLNVSCLRRDQAFRHEIQARFFAGFIKKRLKQWRMQE